MMEQVALSAGRSGSECVEYSVTIVPIWYTAPFFIDLDKVSLDFYIYQLFNIYTERLLDKVVPLN
ncbi:hypothetical protein [uncultured Holdemanella sp.]|uniref:hypothetical protein n=1 Tax=uncultured Holdemanella sp. TaxID=1763549 RepID=UPI0025DB0E92|nr:hypothetical protein [uncultured Holdemanella sp.]